MMERRKNLNDKFGFVGKIMRKKTTIKDIACFSKGSQINGDLLLDEGKYEYLNGGTKASGTWNEFNVNGKTITISEGGNSCGYVNFMKEKFWCGAHCYYLFDVKCKPKYLYYLLKGNQSNLMKLRSGACMPNIKKSDLGNFKFIYDSDVIHQDKIISIFDNLTNVIYFYEKQIKYFDNLVKARFIEMFGTLDDPADEFEKATLKKLCNKITDGKHGGCTSEEGTQRYFVGAREIYDDEVHYDTAPEINVEEFEKDYKRCNIEIGDFLIVNTGATIGKSAIASDERTEHTLLQKSVALLKVKKDKLNPVFLKWCYRVNTRMYMIQSASAQPNLLLSKINGTVIYVPSIELQEQFANFVQQVDKSREAVKKSLEKTQQLYDSLMQEYFG